MTERAHVSLNVVDLERSVAFYRSFLAAEPVKHTDDYAKFETASLVLSLEPVFHRASNPFNHLGLRLESAHDVATAQKRLVESGLLMSCEDSVECCYSTQTKLWLADPDQNLWEVYALTGAIDHRGASATSQALAHRKAPQSSGSCEHRLGEPLPHALMEGNASAFDEVCLRGTFNGTFSDGEARALLDQCVRTLKPGGRLVIHALVADRALDGSLPPLPGPAAPVRSVPVLFELLALVEAAGLRSVYLQKLSSVARLKHRGVAMRELLLLAFTDAEQGAEEVVIYRGPFAEAVDERGGRFRRGVATVVDGTTATRLRQGAGAEAFTFCGRRGGDESLRKGLPVRT